MENIHTQDINKTWDQYGLQEQEIGFNGEKTGYKAIVQNNKVVYIGSSDFKLYPNQEMVKAADQAAVLMGAVPFDKFTGQWFTRANKHVFLTGENKAQAHALYTFNNSFDIGGGDTINLGFAVHNSINGSMGFSIGAFTFRHACANMVFMGYRGNKMSFDDRETIAYIYNKHSKNMEIDPAKLQQLILNVVEQSKQIISQYREWRNQEINQKLAERLVKKLPIKYLPECIKAEPDKIELLSTPDLWTAYNDMTALIWHNDKTDYSTKKHLFDEVHKVLISQVL